MIRKLRIRFIVVATLSAAIVILAVSCGILLTNRCLLYTSDAADE